MTDRADRADRADGADGADVHPQDAVARGDTEDVGYFDGSCGQRARHLKALRHGSGVTIDQQLLERWSWALFLRDRFAPSSGDEERPLRAGRTVAEVEGQALVALLDAYVRYAGQGPLLVVGDHQGVLALMQRVGRPATGPLAALAVRATHLAQQVPLGVRYHWLPRSENRLTDRLASHSHAQQWGAEACQWWVSAWLSAPASAAGRVAGSAAAEAIRCRHCAQRKPLWCPLSPAKVEA